MKAQKLIIFLLAILIGVAAVAGLNKVFLSGNQAGPAAPAPAEANGKADGFIPVSSGSMNPGDVLIELTPKYIAPKRLVVKFAMNTHSVDLSQFDLKKITTLTYNGKTFKPTDANRLRGHHSFGLIVFDLDNEPENFTITIEGIPSEDKREFTW